jgi:hypothetical protein
MRHIVVLVLTFVFLAPAPPALRPAPLAVSTTCRRPPRARPHPAATLYRA